MKKFRSIFIALLIVSMISFSSCKPYVDIDCTDVTLCVKNVSSDTLFINWHSSGLETDWPVVILPGEEVCKGFGAYQEYGKNGLLHKTYNQSGTNSVYYSTSNGKFYEHPFQSCEDHVEISE